MNDKQRDEFCRAVLALREEVDSRLAKNNQEPEISLFASGVILAVCVLGMVAIVLVCWIW